MATAWEATVPCHSNALTCHEKAAFRLKSVHRNCMILSESSNKKAAEGQCGQQKILTECSVIHTASGHFCFG